MTRQVHRADNVALTRARSGAVDRADAADAPAVRAALRADVARVGCDRRIGQGGAAVRRGGHRAVDEDAARAAGVEAVTDTPPALTALLARAVGLRRALDRAVLERRSVTPRADKVRERHTRQEYRRSHSARHCKNWWRGRRAILEVDADRPRIGPRERASPLHRAEARRSSRAYVLARGVRIRARSSRRQARDRRRRSRPPDRAQRRLAR